jgi:hypothetical protein
MLQLAAIRNVATERASLGAACCVATKKTRTTQSMVAREHLLLDPAIRDWVVIPMVILLVLVALGRNYVSQLIKSTPEITENDLDELRFKQTLQQAQRLRMNGRFISDTAFNMRKAYLIRKETGVLREKVPGAGNPMSNPMAMMDMMKGQMVFMLPNFAMMAFVGYFFSGFVCLKIPFPLPSNHFKLMMQRGVDLSSLDVSYVSSLSWYFLVTFGLNGIMRLLLGSESEFDDAKMMQMQVIKNPYVCLHCAGLRTSAPNAVGTGKIVLVPSLYLCVHCVADGNGHGRRAADGLRRQVCLQGRAGGAGYRQARMARRQGRETAAGRPLPRRRGCCGDRLVQVSRTCGFHSSCCCVSLPYRKYQDPVNCTVLALSYSFSS